jgi:hypothetical protein
MARFMAFLNSYVTLGLLKTGKVNDILFLAMICF